LAWDSVSRGAAKKCWRYYKLAIVDGWQSRQKSVDLVFGIWMHESRERYYHARAAGKSHDEGVDAALAHALEVTWDRPLGRPWASDHPQKNRLTLLRSVVWYLDAVAEDDALVTIVLPNGKPAIELSLSADSGFRSAEGEAFILCGHIDRAVTVNELPFPTDLKTTKTTIGSEASNYFEQFSPDDQMSGYSWLFAKATGSPVTGVIIDAIQVAQGFSRFARGHTGRSPGQLAEWLEGAGLLFEEAERRARSGKYPMNEKSCFLCEFRREVCSRSPGSREAALRAGFVRRVWDPLIARGDV
jgi:hypothetical protein